MFACGVESLSAPIRTNCLPLHNSVFTYVFSLQTMDVLNLANLEASSWLEAQLPWLHLLLGDSIARESMMGSRIRDDEFLSRARGVTPGVLCIPGPPGPHSYLGP